MVVMRMQRGSNDYGFGVMHRGGLRWVQTAHKKATLPGKGGLRDKVVEGDRPSTLPCQIGGRSFQGVDNSKRRGDGFDPGEESDQVRLSTMKDRSICHAKIAPAPPWFVLSYYIKISYGIFCRHFRKAGYWRIVASCKNYMGLIGPQL